jgi:hypothetical protein
MNISFGKSAYVPGTPDDILDNMDRSELSITATADSLVIITMESVMEYLNRYEHHMTNYEKIIAKSLATFLTEAITKINEANDGTPIGDIFFTS